MADPNTSWGQLLSTTLQKRSDDVFDNFTNKNALMNRIMKNGNMKKRTGSGATILKALQYQENSGFKFYSGAELLNTSKTDVITSAEFQWKQAACPVVVTGLEMAQNMGESQVFSILEELKDNATSTMYNQVSTSLYSAGTGSGGKEIGGLQLLVPDDPTTGTAGGINRATWSFWRSQLYDLSANTITASASTIQQAMRNLHILCRRGSESTDLIMSSNEYYLYFEGSFEGRQYITNTEMANAGWMNIQFHGAPVIPDGGSGIPATHMYFLNTKHLFFEIHPNAAFKATEAIRPTNQDAEIIHILLYCALTTNWMSGHGVLIA